MEETAGFSPEISDEMTYHLSLQYKELYRKVHLHLFQDEELSKAYRRKDRLMELTLTFALLVPLVASVLTTINANYKNVALAIATGVIGAVASGMIGLLNGIKNNFKFLQSAQFYHDRAVKMAEIQDTISVAINLRMFDASEYFEQSARFELIIALPVGSDITGTGNLVKIDKITEGNVSLRGTPLKHLPPALEKQILATHASSPEQESPTSSRERSREVFLNRNSESGRCSPAVLRVSATDSDQLQQPRVFRVQNQDR